MAINEKRSYTEVDVTQPTSDFDIGFKFYENRDGINSTVDGVPAAEAGYTTQLVNSNTVRFTPSVLAGAVVRIMRETNIDRNVYQFSSGALWTAEQMDENFEQIRHSQQESRDTAIETRRRFDRLNTQVQTVVGGLNEALTVAEQAAVAAEGAAEAADAAAKAAEEASELTRSAENVIDSSGKTQQWFNDKTKRENTSVWDFFTVGELGAYRASPSSFDATRPLQAFFDYISANNVGRATCDADLWVQSAVKLGGAGGTLTKHIQGYLKLTAINTSLTATSPIETLFTFQPASNLRWEGVIHVVGSSVNALNYDRRHVRNGILLGGEYSATHSSIDFIIAENGFKEYGIVQGNLTTGLVIGKIRGTRSGSGYVVGGYTASLYSNFTRISDTSGTGTQRTTISVVNFPDYKSQVGYVVINGEAYLITSKNEADKTLEIFPILPTGVTTGNLKYAFGGVFYTTGGDASVANIGNINCSTSGISVQLSALYPPTIGSITTQNNFCALSLGASISAGLEGGTIGELYFEALEFGIIQNTRYAATNITITNNVSFNPDNCIHIGNYRASDGSIDRTYPLGINIVYEGVTTQLQDFRTANTITVPIFSPNSNPIVCAVFTQPKIVNLTEGKKSLHRLFGYSNRTIKFVGATGNVTQSITFNPPAGYTLNGQSSPLVFSNIGGTPVFEVIYHSGVNVTVSLVGKAPQSSLSASVTYDPANLAPNEIQYWNVTLNGVKLGDMVACSFSRALNGTRIWAECTGANIVTVYHQNPTAAAVDIASGTLSVKVI